MFPNDLWQSHLLTRPALGKILIIPGGKGEELLGVQLDSWAGATAAAMPCCAGWCPCRHVPLKATRPSLHAQWSLVQQTRQSWQQGAAPDGGHLSPLHPSEKQGLTPPTHSPSGKIWTISCPLFFS